MVGETYRSIIGVGIGTEEAFLAALYAFAESDEKAVSWVRKKARCERDEYEQFAMREALSSLPDVAEELIEAIEDPGCKADINGWADALGATSDCAICSTTVIHPFSFAESAVPHYERITKYPKSMTLMSTSELRSLCVHLVPKPVVGAMGRCAHTTTSRQRRTTRTRRNRHPTDATHRLPVVIPFIRPAAAEGETAIRLQRIALSRWRSLRTVVWLPP